MFEIPLLRKRGFVALAMLVLAIGGPPMLGAGSNEDLVVGGTTYVPPSEPATPVTPSEPGEHAEYIFVGIGSGDIGGQVFSDAAFTIILSGDTSDICECQDPGIYELEGPSTIDIGGFPTAEFLIGTRVFSNVNVEVVGFSRALDIGGSDMLDLADPAFAGYTLDTSLGPVFEDEPSAVYQFNDVSTSLGVLNFYSIDHVTFEAIIGGVDDVPATSNWSISLTVVLLLTASTAVLLWRRRRSKT